MSATFLDDGPDLWERVALSFGGGTDKPLWNPQPKQKLATRLAEKADEVLFGGQVGGGKTEWLVCYAAEEMERVPGNRGVIFRRVFPSLARTVLPRAQSILEGRARWNGQDHSFTFPNGSVLQLSHLQLSGDKGGRPSHLDHQGTEYGLVGFEELTEFTLAQYEYMLTRLRAGADGIRPHAIATANPGGPGHAWVKRRFIKPRATDLADGQDPPQPYEVWQPVSTDDNPKPGTRVYVPSALQDNPALLKRDPDYLSRVLSAVSDRGLRLAMAEGDWDAIDAVKGALWLQSWLDAGRKKGIRAIDIDRTVVALDPSDADEKKGSDEFGVSAGSRLMNGSIAVRYSGGWYGSPRTIARRAIDLYHELRADALVVEKNHGGVWLPEVLRNVNEYVNIRVVHASTGKRTRAEAPAALFETDPKHRLTHRAFLVGYHEQLEEELTTFTGKVGELSPNRLDAMVWAVTDLMSGVQTQDQAKDERRKGRR